MPITLEIHLFKSFTFQYHVIIWSSDCESHPEQKHCKRKNSLLFQSGYQLCYFQPRQNKKQKSYRQNKNTQNRTNCNFFKMLRSQNNINNTLLKRNEKKKTKVNTKRKQNTNRKMCNIHSKKLIITIAKKQTISFFRLMQLLWQNST